MEKDFHYYLVYSMAKVTGCDDADIIAYASQFVDDNNEGQFSIDGKKTGFPQKIEANGGYYCPLMTQSLSTKSLDRYIHQYVYIPFHFLPGNNDVIIEGKKNSYSTTPDSKNAGAMLIEALKSKNPYRIGIALHTYADTWSHQNFTGLREEWNSVYPWYNVFKSIVPNIGHAEAGHLPDIISERWTDHRFNKRIKNKERAFVATREIYKALRKYSRCGPFWSDVKNSYKKIINASDYDHRKRKIKDFLESENLGQIPKYSKDNWIDEALNKGGAQVVMEPNFKEKHWFKFHQAAKAHFAHVLNLIKCL
jgi:hypothetical protein